MCTIFVLGSNLGGVAVGGEEDAYEDEVMAKDVVRNLREVDEFDEAIVSHELDETMTLKPLLDSESLWTGAEDGDMDVVERCVACGVDLDAVDETDRYSAVLIAAEGGHLDIVEALHEAGARVDTRDAFGRTPLYAAAVAGHSDVVAYLAGTGADVDAPDDDGRTPFWAACATRQVHTAGLLADLGASLDVADKRGSSAFDFASQNGHADVIDLLKKRGACRPKSRLRAEGIAFDWSRVVDAGPNTPVKTSLGPADVCHVVTPN